MNAAVTSLQAAAAETWRTCAAVETVAEMWRTWTAATSDHTAGTAEIHEWLSAAAAQDSPPSRIRKS